MAVLTTLDDIEKFAYRIDWACNALPDVEALSYVANNKGHWEASESLTEFSDRMKQHIIAEFCEHPIYARWIHEDNEDYFFCEDCKTHSEVDDSDDEE
jgi:hypothetical protein